MELNTVPPVGSCSTPKPNSICYISVSIRLSGLKLCDIMYPREIKKCVTVEIYIPNITDRNKKSNVTYRWGRKRPQNIFIITLFEINGMDCL